MQLYKRISNLSMNVHCLIDIFMICDFSVLFRFDLIETKR